jgi:hypothetical protein
LDSLQLTLPYSGILHPIYVDQAHLGDVYSAFDESFTQGIAKEVKERAESLEALAYLSEAGLDIPKEISQDVARGSGKWLPVAEAAKYHSLDRKNNPSETGIKLKQVFEEVEKEKGEQ